MSYYRDPLNDPEHVRSLRAFFGVLVVSVALAAVAIFFSTGCNTTVAPKPVESSHASFDGNDANSGILAADPAGRGYIITAHARDRYKALVAQYSREFSPPLTLDAGVTPLPDGTAIIDREHLVKFIQMARWRKAGIAPLNP